MYDSRLVRNIYRLEIVFLSYCDQNLVINILIIKVSLEADNCSHFTDPTPKYDEVSSSSPGRIT